MDFEKYYIFSKTYNDIDSPEYKKRMEELTPYLSQILQQKGRVLDLACGVGGFSFFFEELGHEVVGLDISDFLLEKAKRYAKEKNSKVEFVKGDARELPFKDESFDYVVFLGNSIVHFTPTELNQVFKEIKRVLKHWGQFILNYNDMRAVLPLLERSEVIADGYWVNRIYKDKDEKYFIAVFESPEGIFEVKFNLWGKTAVDLLSKLYFIKEKSIEIRENSYLEVFRRK
ncbi:hypothetical protein PAP_08365 [Palaeococcus pacificus DY20341]|uniref:Methyltransferase domain-containing protein n=1 Tax=Palaeococcus pacificus DY20341 TaxID=1343739 RepID=A0A075LV90_9EURY|nr:class I SAM-dependent methyltransferase [Palaeococcus pacificus]AIF70061.1 hypothetical protein PAP_08365 [Palaeococcus pacificus DY20341]